jgi:hypothetical protein
MSYFTEKNYGLYYPNYLGASHVNMLGGGGICHGASGLPFSYSEREVSRRLFWPERLQKFSKQK